MDSTLLLIHSDLDQAGVLCNAFKQVVPEIVLSLARDTMEVRQCPIPGMILLDLDQSAPFEILKWLRYHDSYRRIPVIALASSPEPGEVTQAYELGANSCVLKSEGGIAAEVARGIGTYLKVLQGPHQIA
jgi:CheY-like chemotaxis protein